MKNVKNKALKFTLLGAFLFTPYAFAAFQAPTNVADVDNQNVVLNATGQTQSNVIPSAEGGMAQNALPQLTDDQRISKLEHQVANQQQLNISAQIQQLQLEIEDLRGRLQVQEYALNRLRRGRQLASSSVAIKPEKPIVAPAVVTTKKDAINTLPKTDLIQKKAILPMLLSSSPKKIPPVYQTSKPLALPKTASSETLPVQQGSGGFLQDQNSYTVAYNLITARQYPEAITAMQGYLKNYPKGRYLSNAYYWLGELYLIQNNDKLAENAFQTVINQFPQSNKLSDAMLKLGFVYYDNGQLNKAKVLLEKVGKQFSGTTVARLAQARLQDINQQINSSD